MWPNEHSLVNEAQILLINRASVRALARFIDNSDVDELVTRFRANLVVDGCQPFEEDAWQALHIGAVRFRVVKLCTRCQMICIDQRTGEKNPQVLNAVRRVKEGKMHFGVYLEIDASSITPESAIEANAPVTITHRL